MKDVDLKVGDRVRVVPAKVDDFIVSMQRQIRDRTGVVRAKQAFSDKPIVLFEKVGRRKEYQWVPPTQGGPYLEKIGG